MFYWPHKILGLQQLWSLLALSVAAVTTAYVAVLLVLAKNFPPKRKKTLGCVLAAHTAACYSSFNTCLFCFVNLFPSDYMAECYATLLAIPNNCLQCFSVAMRLLQSTIIIDLSRRGSQLLLQRPFTLHCLRQLLLCILNICSNHRRERVFILRLYATCKHIYQLQTALITNIHNMIQSACRYLCDQPGQGLCLKSGYRASQTHRSCVAMR